MNTARIHTRLITIFKLNPAPGWVKLCLVLGFVVLSRGTAGAAPNTPLLLTDTYPLAVAALNLTAQTSWRVEMLVAQNGGCPHHYQLKAQDWAKLSDAKLLLVNGLGLDVFLPAVQAKFKTLPIITLEQNLDLLPAPDPDLLPAIEDHDHHHHDHHDHDHDHGDHHDHATAFNPHVWLGVDNMMAQVRQMQAVLEQQSDSAKDKKQIKQNGRAYLAQLKTLAKEVKTLRTNLKKKAKNQVRRVLVLSDALAYLARDVGWTPFVWSKEEDNGFSPRELAALVELMQKDKIQIMMAEEAQLKTAQTLASATKAQVILGLNLLQGPWEKDAYLNLMRQNLKRIKDAVK